MGLRSLEGRRVACIVKGYTPHDNGEYNDLRHEDVRLEK
jgi:hypothetical protein